MNLINSFILYKKTSGKGLKGNSIEKYSNELNRLLMYFREIKGINDDVELIKSINQIDMDGFKQWMIDKNLSISTINGQITTCKQFSNYLLARNIISDDFSKGLKQVSKNNRSGIFKPLQIRPAVIKKDFNILLEMALIKRPNTRCFEFNSTRNVLILMVMATTGFRIESDLLSLKLEDITEDNGVIYFNKKPEDTKNDLPKRVPIVGKCREYYDKYIKMRNNLPTIIDKEYLILSARGKKFNRKNSNDFINEYCEYGNIDKHYTNHCLRHTFSSVGNAIGISHAVLNNIGGWTPDNMQDWYANGIDDETRIEAVTKIEDYLLDIPYLQSVGF